MDGNQYIFRNVPESCSVDKWYTVNELTKNRKDTVMSSNIKQKTLARLNIITCVILITPPKER